MGRCAKPLRASAKVWPMPTWGGGVIKQRIARVGEGKSGGYRSIMLFRAGGRAFFVYGFAKNAQDNISAAELAAFRAAASVYMAMKEEAIAELMAKKRLKEITCDGQGL